MEKESHFENNINNNNNNLFSLKKKKNKLAHIYKCLHGKLSQ